MMTRMLFALILALSILAGSIASVQSNPAKLSKVCEPVKVA